MKRFEIRKHDKPTSFKAAWFYDSFRKIRQVIPSTEISDQDLKTYLLNKYSKRTTVNGRFYNNVTRSNTVMTIEEFINKFFNSDTILTEYNVLIKDHEHSDPSVAIEALSYLLSERSKNKKLMQSYPKGSDEYQYYRNIQLTLKILCNSYYGILSMDSSTFYNPHIQNSITVNGRNLISSAIYLVESFISNNEKFNDFDDCITFISDIVSYENIQDYHLNIHKTVQEVADYLTTRFVDSYRKVSSIEILPYLVKCSQDQLDLLYYKDQLLEIFKNDYYINTLKSLCSKEYGEKDAFETNKDVLNFTVLVSSLCNYVHIAYDKLMRISHQKRNVSLVTDTDSTFVYLGNTIESLENMTNVHSELFTQNCTNLLINIVSDALKNTFSCLTGNCGISKTYQPIINIKNEFVYSRLMMTDAKKNYAGWLKYELGKEIPGNDPDQHLDIKGLAIRKTTVAKTLRESFQNLLVNDILTPPKIIVSNVLKDYNKISKEVEESIRRGETTFLIPLSTKSFSEYANPSQQKQVRSILSWNALEPDSEIVAGDNVNCVELISKTKDCPQLLALQQTEPNKFKNIMSVAFSPKNGDIDYSRFGFDCCALPLDRTHIPDYLTPLIDYDSMVSKNISNANILLKSLGIVCKDENRKGTKTNYKSNIIDF